jgi:succinylglutamate desuccinylase
LKDLERRLGAYPPEHSRAPGPLLVVVGGLHGNEPAGVLAARRVFDQLERSTPPMAGQLVALAGNLSALALGRRYLERDLNRAWLDDEVERLRSADEAELTLEECEMRGLLLELDALLSRAWERIVLLDLHSTSADGSPFSIMADTLQNRVVARALPIPVLLGLEERVDGTLLSYFAELGHTALCVEGGQNALLSTIEHHEAAIWLTLVAAGLLAPEDAPLIDERYTLLEESAWGLPRVIEVRHRQGVPRDGEFEMVPGYANFHRVTLGETLGTEHTERGERPVRTPTDGLLLMPRYQGQGEDAFFVGREVHSFWLKLSGILRRMRLEWVLPLLPGIRRDDREPRMLHVDHRFARWYPLEVLHLFGYRRRLRIGTHTTFLRRRDEISLSRGRRAFGRRRS